MSVCFQKKKKKLHIMVPPFSQVPTFTTMTPAAGSWNFKQLDSVSYESVFQLFASLHHGMLADK